MSGKQSRPCIAALGLNNAKIIDGLNAVREATAIGDDMPALAGDLEWKTCRPRDRVMQKG